jgi:hypothetical protein
MDLTREIEVEITPEMIEAEVERLAQLLEADTGSAYVVSKVYLAMVVSRLRS